MFVGICGGLCAGKNTVAQYLIDNHGFQRLHLARPPFSSPGQPRDPAGSSDPSSPPDRRHFFATPSALLDFVTSHWQSHWVTTDVHDESVLDIYDRRPFFILVSVDAPVGVRWKRHQARALDLAAPSRGSLENGLLPSQPEPQLQSQPQSQPQPPSTTTTSPTHSLDPTASFSEFVAGSDSHLYDARHGLLPLIGRATVRLLNTGSSLDQLHATLDGLALTSPERLRPSWDAYFMALASLAARRSNCMKRRVGAVLVGHGRRVLSTGYNGTPRGLTNCAEGGCPRCNDATGSGHGLATCLCIHAEENALLEAGRERIRDGSILYCDTCPCLTCSIKICQVGIGEVVYNQGYSMDNQTAAVFKEAGVKLRQFSPPPDGLIHLEDFRLLE